MSNKTQLQTNNTKYASLIETLRGKAVSGSAEDLDTELTEQENLISQLSTILDSKASGGSGGGVGTCTIIINIDADAHLANLAYSFVENNTIKSTFVNYSTALTNTSVTLENVVCGSYMSIGWGGVSPGVDYNLAVALAPDMSYYEDWQAPTASGVTETISLIGDD